MNRIRILTSITGTAILGAALTIWVWPGVSETAGAARRSREVRVAAVERSSGGRTVRFPGVVRAAREASLAFTVPGRLTARPVEVGDRVRPGQELASVDGREFENAARAAEARAAELSVRLAQAERDLERVQRLAEVKAATSEELEKVTAVAGALRSAHAAVQARLADARRVVEEAVLRAPFSGTVTAVHLEPGEWASPGIPVLELSGDGALELEVELPETVLHGIEEGQPATVQLPLAGGRVVGGRLQSVARAAVGAGRLFPVVVDLEKSEGILPGMAAELVLEVASEGCLTVPVRAVLNPGASRPSVFRVQGGRAEQVDVELGRLVGDRVEVRGALSAGERVVVAGHTALADGDAVEVIGEENSSARDGRVR